jgi:hypothetical protein
MYEMSQMKKIQKSRHIVVSNDNHLKLKRLGQFGDTFDDIVTNLLERASKSDLKISEQKKFQLLESGE